MIGSRTDGKIKKIDSFVESGYRIFSSDFKEEIQLFFLLLLDSNNLPYYWRK